MLRKVHPTNELSKLCSAFQRLGPAVFPRRLWVFSSTAKLSFPRFHREKDKFRIDRQTLSPGRILQESPDKDRKTAVWSVQSVDSQCRNAVGYPRGFGLNETIRNHIQTFLPSMSIDKSLQVSTPRYARAHPSVSSRFPSLPM
jgi:hypothetical protein